MDTQHLVQLSIICQLLDSGADLKNLNPNVREYLLGLQSEMEDEYLKDKEFYNKLYFYADIFFNEKHNNLN